MINQNKRSSTKPCSPLGIKTTNFDSERSNEAMEKAIEIKEKIKRFFEKKNLEKT
jgi:hypothetical protein